MTIAEKLTPVAHFPLESEIAKPLPEESPIYLPTPPSTQERYEYKNPSRWWAYWGLFAFFC